MSIYQFLTQMRKKRIYFFYLSVVLLPVHIGTLACEIASRRNELSLIFAIKDTTLTNHFLCVMLISRLLYQKNSYLENTTVLCTAILLCSNSWRMGSILFKDESNKLGRVCFRLLGEPELLLCIHWLMCVFLFTCTIDVKWQRVINDLNCITIMCIFL